MIAPLPIVHPLDHAYDPILDEPSDAELELAALAIGPDTTADDVALIIRIAVTAKANAEAQAAEWKGVEALAREKLAEVFQATGTANWHTPAGRAYQAADGASVSYDSAALDALVKSSPELALVLLPHRKETCRRRPVGPRCRGPIQDRPLPLRRRQHH